MAGSSCLRNLPCLCCPRTTPPRSTAQFLRARWVRRRAGGCWDGPAFETQGKMRLPKPGADPAPRLFFQTPLQRRPHGRTPRTSTSPLFFPQFWNRLSNWGFFPDFLAGPPLALPQHGGMDPVQTLIAQQNPRKSVLGDETGMLFRQDLSTGTSGYGEREGYDGACPHFQKGSPWSSR